jgi:hypothetical protein
LHDDRGQGQERSLPAGSSWSLLVQGFPTNLVGDLNNGVESELHRGWDGGRTKPRKLDLAKKEFIAAHATEQDRNELVQQLMHPVKPRSLGVQAFLHHLFELNEAVVLLPGEAAALTAQQVKQVFYDGMPAARKQRLFHSNSDTQLEEGRNSS